MGLNAVAAHSAAASKPVMNSATARMIAREVEFVTDSPLETIGSKSIAEFNGLRPNSLRIGTGNLIRPCRELIRAIREFFRLIRESGAGRDFTAT
jgi:hypothetical protein